MRKQNVVHNLKRNFLLIVMGMMTVLLLSAFIIINTSNQQYNEDYYLTRMEKIAQRDGMLPRLEDEEQTTLTQRFDENFEMDAYVAVQLDENNEIQAIISSSIQNLDVTAVSDFVQHILSLGADSGESDGLVYLIQEKSYGSIMVLMDVSGQKELETRLLLLSGGILGFVWLIIFGVAILLSRWVSRPVEKAFASQARFVADASHELKTPLAVINANLAVLQGKAAKENKWISYIKEESDRMNGLVSSLLALATMDDPSYQRNDSSFLLDEMVESCLLPFESVAFEKGVLLEMACESGITMTGDRGKLSQMLRILADNALKHTQEGGRIIVEAKRRGNKRILSVYNEGKPIDQGDLAKIFQRFYRSDFARDRQSGGYGLGLAMAKAIVELHRGRIYAEPGLLDGARFVVEL